MNDTSNFDQMQKKFLGVHWVHVLVNQQTTCYSAYNPKPATSLTLVNQIPKCFQLVLKTKSIVYYITKMSILRRSDSVEELIINEKKRIKDECSASHLRFPSFIQYAT